MTREEAIQVLKKYKRYAESILTNEVLDSIAFDMAIESLSADAVHGEWIDKEIPCNPFPPVFCFECSACGYIVGRETFLENTFNYCPNCGADMRGEK